HASATKRTCNVSGRNPRACDQLLREKYVSAFAKDGRRSHADTWYTTYLLTLFCCSLSCLDLRRLCLLDRELRAELCALAAANPPEIATVSAQVRSKIQHVRHLATYVCNARISFCSRAFSS